MTKIQPSFLLLAFLSLLSLGCLGVAVLHNQGLLEIRLQTKEIGGKVLIDGRNSHQ